MCLVESFCLALGLADVGVLHPLVGGAPLHGRRLQHRPEHVKTVRLAGGLSAQPVLVLEGETISHPGPVILMEDLQGEFSELIKYSTNCPGEKIVIPSINN